MKTYTKTVYLASRITGLTEEQMRVLQVQLETLHNRGDGQTIEQRNRRLNAIRKAQSMAHQNKQAPRGAHETE